MEDELRLWLIEVGRLRQCFAARGELADRLRAITAAAVMPPRKRPGLLSMLGPLMRQPIEGAVIQPDVPNYVDAEAMMTGRFVTNDRLGACWSLLGVWLSDLAVAGTALSLPKDKIDELEFDLVRAGVPTRFSIRHLWGQSLDVPLRATNRMSIGFMEGENIAMMVEQWRWALPKLETSTAEFATGLLDFLTEDYGQSGYDLVAW